MQRTAVTKIYTDQTVCITLWNQEKMVDWLAYITITNLPKFNGLIPFKLNIPGYGRYKTEDTSHKLNVSSEAFGKLHMELQSECNSIPYKLRIVQEWDDNNSIIVILILFNNLDCFLY